MHGPISPPEAAIDENAPLPYRVFHTMRSVMHAQKQLFVRKLGDKDTHPGQAISLWMLSENEGISQGDLAEKLGVARPTVTIMLKKMEKAGLIERRADESDQRSKRIFLTQAGRSLHANLKAVHAEVVEFTIGQMSEDDQRELERLLRIIEENLTAAQ
ncbi:MAG: MarR family transcriptional regulator [Coriobacteriia bacterium]|nr:MarR family transcriptional regulator [Coriobacteriia bacterium]